MRRSVDFLVGLRSQCTMQWNSSNHGDPLLVWRESENFLNMYEAAIVAFPATTAEADEPLSPCGVFPHGEHK